jgi:hypothetical protein
MNSACLFVSVVLKLTRDCLGTRCRSDIVFVHKLAMEPHKRSFCVPLRHWRTAHAAPQFRITPRRSTAEVIALDIDCFTALLDAGIAINWNTKCVFVCC